MAGVEHEDHETQQQEEQQEDSRGRDSRRMSRRKSKGEEQVERKGRRRVASWTWHLTVLLMTHWVITPVLMSWFCTVSWWAGILDFFLLFPLWSIYYVAQEPEDPFGDDVNDLPLAVMQDSFNQHLVTLIMAESRILQAQWAYVRYSYT